MEFPKGIFKANDIRGLLPEITVELAEQVGRVLVQKYQAKKVLVGRDMRETSPQLAEAMIAGITAAGADVVSMGMVTTSLFNWAVTTQGVDVGVMITASHNPAEYNGIKVALADGEPVSGERLFTLMNLVVPNADVAGRVEEKEFIGEYLAYVLAAAGTLPSVKDVKLVVDYGSGMGAVTFAPLLARLGIQAVELYEEPDARFPYHEANPAKESTLIDLKAKMKEIGADFGVAIDGDGDRIGFVDSEGVTLRGDQTLALLVQAYLQDHDSAKVVVAPNHGWASADAMREAGAELIEDRIGRTFAIRKMRESGAEIGGEISSHFFFKPFRDLESIDYTFLLILLAWKRSGSTFADLVRPLRTFVNSGEVNIEVEAKDAVIARVKEVYIPQATIVNELDGIRCEFGRDWWFIVRASNTEPVIRLTVEATSEDVMRARVDELVELMTRGE